MLFGKKKNTDDVEESDYDELEEDGDRRLTKKITDLQPENRKKRKEPPKPWGKKERMIVLVTFVATVVVTGILAASAQGYKFGKTNFNNFPLPDLRSLNILKKETIIVEK